MELHSRYEGTIHALIKTTKVLVFFPGYGSYVHIVQSSINGEKGPKVLKRKMLHTKHFRWKFAWFQFSLGFLPELCFVACSDGDVACSFSVLFGVAEGEARACGAGSLVIECTLNLYWTIPV